MPAGSNPGDMLYWDGSQWLKIAVGQNGQALILQNGIPTWGGVQLPILNTSAVTNITAFTAYCGGNIASDGDSTIVGRGICWNTSPNPTTGNFKVFAGSGAGNFLAQMTGLESSTQYYVRAFATNSAGTSYGQEMSFFTTAGAITLSTTAITNITVNSATSGGNITLNGGSPVTARGVCWNTAPYPTLANNKTTDGTGNGTFVSQLTGLTNNTQYYIRAYATNSLGTSYGNQLTFATLSGIVTLTTAEVTNIAYNSGISGGEITNDGGSPVTARGICWNTAQNPTIADNKTTDGNGTGTFVSILSGLTVITTYYLRAYATNGFGTYYGNELIFTTMAWGCGNPLVDSRDGQTYNTVQIGEQCWMAENLNVGTRIEGSQNQTDNGVVEKYCYDNLESNCDVYGGLYQWDEMMEYSTMQGIKGICPEGWYLPTDNQFSALSDDLGGSSVAGGKMKSTGTIESGTGLWYAPNTGATNLSGFSGLPSGYRSLSGSFSTLNSLGRCWTSTQSSTTTSWRRSLNYDDISVNRGSNDKGYGFTVRCLINESTTINQQPAFPSDNIPENSSINVSIIHTLSWSCTDPDGDPLTYDVFFGTENPPAQVATAIVDTFYTPGTLNYNTTYYWKIIAHDDHGNSTEGDVWNFTTRSWQCGDLLSDERDGQEYNTVQIGEQCWMAENLNVGTRIDGSSNQTNNNTLEKYCYNNSESHCDVYGGLYQWSEMMQYTENQGIKGICMDGWHVPTDAEWSLLTNYLSSLPIYWCNNNPINIAKALASTFNWNSSGSSCDVGNNQSSNNSTGFTGFPGGGYNKVGSMGSFGYWWSSTANPTTSAWGRYIYGNNGIIERNSNFKTSGYSARCVRD